MKNDTVKTVTIVVDSFGLFRHKDTYIFDVSESLAKEIIANYEDQSKTLHINNVPTKHGTMTLVLNKDRIEYVTVE